jgi:hypothetical protein
MKVRNKTKAVVYIGNKIIKPGEVTELSKKELEFTGVKAMIESKELEIVEEEKRVKKKKE